MSPNEDRSTTKAIVDVAMTPGGEAESLSIYSCLAGLKVLDAPPANIQTLVCGAGVLHTQQ